MTLPAHLWRPFSMTDQPDGTPRLVLDGVPWFVRGLTRGADGVVRGECQFEDDGWVEAFCEGREEAPKKSRGEG